MLGRQTDAQPNEYIGVKQGSAKTGCRQTSAGNAVLPRKGRQGRRVASFR